MTHPWTERDVPDQTGRVALVTGANSGLGFATASALAARGATVLLGCRDPRRGDDARRRIETAVPGARVELLPLDLASLASVRAAAAEAGGGRLDLLINNAGVMATPRRVTEDGFEQQLGTNHLGHFVLTGLLLPALLRTPGSRVVSVTSTLHRIGRVDFDDLHGERGYDRWRRYAQSKVANLLFTHELQRRLGAAGARCSALACHPGAAATELARELGAQRRIADLLFARYYQTPAQGALPALRAATDPDARGGDFFGPSGFGELRGAPTRVTGSAYSLREDTAARLWSESERLTGISASIG